MGGDAINGPCWKNPMPFCGGIDIDIEFGTDCCNKDAWKYSFWYAWAYESGIPKLLAVLSASASCSLFSLARLFWNQIFTWVSVSLRYSANSALSATDKYFWCRNFRSSAISCVLVNGVLGFRSFFCFFIVAVLDPLEWGATGKKESEINTNASYYTWINSKDAAISAHYSFGMCTVVATSLHIDEHNSAR